MTHQHDTRPRAALPAGAPPVRPYVMTQILADLGVSSTPLAGFIVKRIKSTLPVPTEQAVLWADVAMGTRTHGLVLTDAGVFMKDGPNAHLDDDEDDEDDEYNGGDKGQRGDKGYRDGRDGKADEDGEAAGEALTGGEGLGFRYIRWESFDPARVSHRDGAPTLDGEPFLDPEPFRDFAMACVRINNRRVRARKAARSCDQAQVLWAEEAPVRSVCRASAGATLSWCFDEDGDYRFYVGAPADTPGPDPAPDVPKVLEVPSDQYDAALARFRRAIEEGHVFGLDDPAAAGALVRRGGFTYTQAVNLAKTGRVPNVDFRPRTGSVVCRDPRGLSHWLNAWLTTRESLGNGELVGEPDGQTAGGIVGEALVQGAQARAASERDPRVAAGEGAARMVAGTVAANAGYAVGATGARVILSAVGMASGPLAAVASFALGDIVGKKGGEALSMAKGMLVEPRERIMGRLFDGVLSNVAFEYALTTAEQGLLAELMVRANPTLFQALGARLAEPAGQEAAIRSLLVPLVEAIRRV